MPLTLGLSTVMASTPCFALGIPQVPERHDQADNFKLRRYPFSSTGRGAGLTDALAPIGKET
jgi:hypothetical protein